MRSAATRSPAADGLRWLAHNSGAERPRGPPRLTNSAAARLLPTVQMGRTQKNKATSGHLGMLKVGGLERAAADRG